MHVSEISYSHEQVFDNKHILQRYLHGGRGKVTLIAPSGKCHTYLFEKPHNKNDFPEDFIFVYILHEDRKMYVGLFDEFGFRATRYSRFLTDTEAFKGAKYICSMSKSQKLINETPMTLINRGVCCRCGRELTSPKALYEGIGKSCKSKLKELCSG